MSGPNIFGRGDPFMEGIRDAEIVNANARNGDLRREINKLRNLVNRKNAQIESLTAELENVKHSEALARASRAGLIAVAKVYRNEIDTCPSQGHHPSIQPDGKYADGRDGARVVHREFRAAFDQELVARGYSNPEEHRSV